MPTHHPRLGKTADSPAESQLAGERDAQSDIAPTSRPIQNANSEMANNAIGTWGRTCGKAGGRQLPSLLALPTASPHMREQRTQPRTHDKDMTDNYDYNMRDGAARQIRNQAAAPSGVRHSKSSITRGSAPATQNHQRSQWQQHQRQTSWQRDDSG